MNTSCKFEFAGQRFLIGAGIIIILMVGCAQPGTAPSSTVVGPTPTPVNFSSQSTETALPTTIEPVEPSYRTAQSIQELTVRSAQIAIGHVTQIAGVINIARDVNDITKPDPRLLAVGQIYHFAVDQILKGNLSSTIDIIQVEGWLDRGPVSDPNSITAAEEASARKNYKAIPLRPGVKYLVFLGPAVKLPPSQYYVGVAEPWRFDLSDQTSVRPESAWDGASQVFPAQPFSSI